MIARTGILAALLALAAGAPAAAGQQAAPAESYAGAVFAALQQTCPAAVAGKIAMNDAAALAKLGYNPVDNATEVAATTATEGRPEGLSKTVDGKLLLVFVYPKVSRCNVSVFGQDRVAVRDMLFQILDNPASNATRDTHFPAANATLDGRRYIQKLGTNPPLRITVVTNDKAQNPLVLIMLEPGQE
jgi:hypothetical protein